MMILHLVDVVCVTGRRTACQKQGVLKECKFFIGRKHSSVRSVGCVNVEAEMQYSSESS